MPNNITYTDPFSDAPNVGISMATMNRWLKIANTMVVTKIFDYIPIYAITIASPGWSGESLRVVQWNFEIGNVFTLQLQQILELVTGLNCLICIRFQDNSGNVVRYKLNGNIGEVLYEPSYDGQVIEKNFSIEVWNVLTTGANVIIPAEIDLSTSVYDTTQDSFDPTCNIVIPPQKLADAVSTCESFVDTSGFGINLPYMPNLSYVFHTMNNVEELGGVVQQWSDANNEIPIVTLPTFEHATLVTAGGLTYIDFGADGESLYASENEQFLSIGEVFFTLNQASYTASRGIFEMRTLHSAAGLSIIQSATTNGQLTLTDLATNTSVSTIHQQLNQWIVFDITAYSANSWTIKIFNMITSALIETIQINAGAVLTPLTNFDVQLGDTSPTGNFYMYEMLFYSVANVNNLNTNLNHFANNGGLGFILPFTFPATAAGNNN